MRRFAVRRGLEEDNVSIYGPAEVRTDWAGSPKDILYESSPF